MSWYSRGAICVPHAPRALRGPTRPSSITVVPCLWPVSQVTRVLVIRELYSDNLSGQSTECHYQMVPQTRQRVAWPPALCQRPGHSSTRASLAWVLLQVKEVLRRSRRIRRSITREERACKYTRLCQQTSRS